jgi:hypothetical protein
VAAAQAVDYELGSCHRRLCIPRPCQSLARPLVAQHWVLLVAHQLFPSARVPPASKHAGWLYRVNGTAARKWTESDAPAGMGLYCLESVRLLEQCKLTEHYEWISYLILLSSSCLKATHNPAML